MTPLFRGATVITPCSSGNSMDKLIAALTELGLTSYESSAYLALLGRSSFTSTELATRAKIPRQRIYDVLASLEEKGLCLARDTSPRSFVGIDPKLALEALHQQRVDEFEREQQRIANQAASLIQELSPLYQVGRGQNDPLGYVDVLADPSRISVKAQELARTVQFRVNSCIKRPFILTKDQNWEAIRKPLKRGVAYRAIYETAALEDEELRIWLTSFYKWGQEIRLISDLPLKMQVFDDEVALIAMQDPVGGLPSFTSIAIRHHGVVTMMNLAFEQLWEKSEPFKE